MRHPVSTPVLIPWVRSTAAASTACVVTMVQGNVLVIGLAHLAIAAQTGLIAGALATLAVRFAGTSRDPRAVAAVLAVAVTVVDYFVHDAMFGSFAVEAVSTGVIAGALSMVGSWAVGRWHATRLHRATPPAEVGPAPRADGSPTQQPQGEAPTVAVHHRQPDPNKGQGLEQP